MGPNRVVLVAGHSNDILSNSQDRGSGGGLVDLNNLQTNFIADLFFPQYCDLICDYFFRRKVGPPLMQI